MSRKILAYKSGLLWTVKASWMWEQVRTSERMVVRVEGVGMFEEKTAIRATPESTSYGKVSSETLDGRERGKCMSIGDNECDCSVYQLSQGNRPNPVLRRWVARYPKGRARISDVRVRGGSLFDLVPVSELGTSKFIPPDECGASSLEMQTPLSFQTIRGFSHSLPQPGS
jgi:hypothetical protein